MASGYSEPLIHSPRSPAAPWPYRGGKGGFAPSMEWIVFFDDFVNTVASNAPTGWSTIIDTGATCTSDTTVPGGVINITSDGTAEGVSIYLPTSVQLSAKKWFMEVRVQLEDADDMDFYFGLSDLSAVTDPEDMWDTSNADGLAFGVADGDATPHLLYDTNNGGPVTTDVDAGNDLEDGTWYVLALEGGGQTDAQVKGYINGKHVVTATQASVPDDLPLAPFVGSRTGGSADHNCLIDYVRFSLER